MVACLRKRGAAPLGWHAEHIQDTMHTRTNVQWDTTKAKDCWRAYLAERKSLQECLKKNK